MNKPAICLLITNFGAGGAQKVFAQQADYLRANFTVHEVVYNMDDPAFHNYGNPTHSLDVSKGRSLVGKLWRIISRSWKLRQVVKRCGAQLCISHMDGANWTNVLAGGHKKILVVHGTMLHDRDQKPWMQWLRRHLLIPFLYRKANCVVAVSKGIAAELEQSCGLTNVCYIPNGFPVNELQQAAHQPIEPAHEPIFQHSEVLINVGRLHFQKNQEALIRILALLKVTHRNLRVIILGDGSLRDDLVAQGRALGLRVYSVWESLDLEHGYDLYFLGQVSNPLRYVRRSDLFIFPSRWEGFPLALCEAMIVGTPTVSAHCPTGPMEIIGEDEEQSVSNVETRSRGTLLEIPEQDAKVSRWAECIRKLLGDRNLILRQAQSAQRRMQTFDIGDVRNQWLNVILSCLQAQSRPRCKKQ